MHHQEAFALFGGNWRAYYDVRDSLLGGGVIECDGEYERGEKSLWYRLTASWIFEPIDCATPITPEGTERLAEADRFRREHLIRPRPPVIDHLERWVRSVQLDEDSADLAIGSITKPESRRRAERLAAVIAHGDPLAKSVGVCPYGRVHSVITRTNRVLRSALRLEGEQLAEIDINAAQPLILGAHAQQEERNKEERTREEESRREGKGKGGGTLSHTLPVFAPILRPNPNDGEHACDLPSDLVDYISVCSGGFYYETLADVLKRPCDSRAARKRVKKVSCWLIMGETVRSSKDWVRYSNRWPTVAALVERLKRDDYRHAAHFLQRAESSLVILGACGDLLRDHPDIAVLSIHDALLTPARHVWDVALALRRPWESLGVKPSLKITRPV
jgi:hypothetical protein